MATEALHLVTVPKNTINDGYKPGWNLREAKYDHKLTLVSKVDQGDKWLWTVKVEPGTLPLDKLNTATELSGNYFIMTYVGPADAGMMTPAASVQPKIQEALPAAQTFVTTPPVVSVTKPKAVPDDEFVGTPKPTNPASQTFQPIVSAETQQAAVTKRNVAKILVLAALAGFVYVAVKMFTWGK